MGRDSSVSSGAIGAEERCEGTLERKLSADWHASRFAWRSTSSGASYEEEHNSVSQDMRRMNDGMSQPGRTDGVGGGDQVFVQVACRLELVQPVVLRSVAPHGQRGYPLFSGTLPYRLTGEPQRLTT